MNDAHTLMLFQIAFPAIENNDDLRIAPHVGEGILDGLLEENLISARDQNT